jgi:acid phosphatase type 7
MFPKKERNIVPDGTVAGPDGEDQRDPQRGVGKQRGGINWRKWLNRLMWLVMAVRWISRMLGRNRSRRMILIFALVGSTLLATHSTQGQGAVVILAAGDIASCSSSGDEATAALLDTMDGIVVALGDNSQSNGTEKAYMECYEPTWGRHKGRTRPVPGNHDYQEVAAPQYYFTYFGANAGEPGKGWYSYDAGGWHIIALNSMLPAWKGTEQEQWLINDLAANASPCILAYWHHPVFHSGAGGLTGRMNRPFQLLYEAGASVILSGDAHHYERFAPMSPSKRMEPTRGIRQFVVGTGGASHTRFGAIWKATQARDNDTFGVLKLTLYPGGYDWQFVPVEGKTFTDSGSAACAQK